APGAVERDQRPPIVVEPFEDLRVDRVGRTDALLVLWIPTFGREFLALVAIQLIERAGDVVAVDELLRIDHRLEEAPPHDLEALLGRGRPPRRLDAADHVPQPRERLPATLAADLDVVHRRSAGVGGVRSGEAD